MAKQTPAPRETAAVREIPDGPADWTVSAPDGALALGGSETTRWRLLAFSGGRPVSVFGLLNGESLIPLAAADGTRTVGL